MKKESADEFRCPKCGGSYFESSNISGPGEMVRHCKGDGRWTCDHAWPISEDWKYFARVDVSRYESPEEFEARTGEPLE